MQYLLLDGNFLSAGQPVLRADNRSYRYGDGVFETMKMINGMICLEEYHFERFFSAIDLLGLKAPGLTHESLSASISKLAEKNQGSRLARIRLSAFGGNGGLYDNRSFHYLVECLPLTESVNKLNENGLTLGIYPDARKACDAFSNLKSASYLPAVMAARFAKQQQYDDCLLLNTNGHIAESTIANLFLIRGQSIQTPPLSEGCVAGVMRRYLLERLETEEKPISEDDLLSADEIFLTNAIHGIRWVKQVKDRSYTNIYTTGIYNRFIEPIWE